MEIKFYDEQGDIKTNLFSEEAENLAKKIAQESERSKGRVNSRTQLRKFYDEVLKFKSRIKENPEKFNSLLPYIKMLNAKVKYAEGRGHVTKEFVDFIKNCLEQVKTKKDFDVFADFFEAFMGFYRCYGKG